MKGRTCQVNEIQAGGADALHIGLICLGPGLYIHCQHCMRAAALLVHPCLGRSPPCRSLLHHRHGIPRCTEQRTRNVILVHS